MADESGQREKIPAQSAEPGDPVARTKHGELTLDQIGGLMPGLGGLMPIIAERFGWMYHAAKGGNWDLAAYQLRKVMHLFRVGKTTRPKWRETIDRYTESSLEPLRQAIADASLEKFEAAARFAVDEANRIHAETGYGYIVYKIQEAAPSHMSLEPPDED